MRLPQQGLKLLRQVAVPRAGSKGAPMKLPRTIGLAVAVSLGPEATAADRREGRRSAAGLDRLIPPRCGRRKAIPD